MECKLKQKDSPYFMKALYKTTKEEKKVSVRDKEEEKKKPGNRELGQGGATGPSYGKGTKK